MAVSKRAWNAHNIKRKAASMENATPSSGVKVNPATVKNPSWVSAGPKASSAPLKINISPSQGWNLGGKPLKKATKKRK
jgi:hypothetical protein